MRWFKHLSGSHDDEKMALLQAELGLEGYGFYWLTLEVIARQMNGGSDKTFVEYPLKIWRNTYGFSVIKLRKFVEFCVKIEIFEAKFSQDKLRIDCPNLLKYRDEWSKRKSREAAAAPEPRRIKETDTEAETEVERDNTLFLNSYNRTRPVEGERGHADVRGGESEAVKSAVSVSREKVKPDIRSGPENTGLPSRARSSRQGFLSCWKIYPVKQGHDEAWREWCRMEGCGILASPSVIRDAVKIMQREDDRWKTGYAPNFAKWLGKRGWNDQPFKKPDKGQPGTMDRAEFLEQARQMRSAGAEQGARA